MTIKMKQVVLLVLIVFLTIGIVNAANITDTNSKDKITKISEEHDTTQVVTKDKINTAKNVTKKVNTTTKAASKTYTTTANNYKELLTKVNHATNTTYDTYTINLKKGTYNATKTINWKNTKGCKKLVINGNQATLNGQNKIQLMTIGENYTVTLKNLKIINFKSGGSGGAISNNGTLKIYNSILNNNEGEYAGGAIDNYGNLTITNSTLNNNTCHYGGAIENHEGTVIVSSSSFINNSGAIANMGTLAVSNSSFIKNKNYVGGAIYSRNRYSTVTVSNSSFVNNTAERDGGAIFYYGVNLTVNNSLFINNMAKYGGAIYLESYYYPPGTVSNSPFITNNSFITNKAIKGGAINCCNVKVTVNNSSFKNNSATGRSIYLEKSDLYSINNNYTENFSEEIKFNGRNIIIDNNYFNKEKISQYNQSNIFIDLHITNNTDIGLGDEIKIIGVLEDKDSIIEEVVITVNNETFTTKTDKYHRFSLVYKTNKIGKNTLTVTYNKIGKYESNSFTRNFNVKKPSNIFLYKLPVATPGKVSKISGKLLWNNKGIKGANVRIRVNGKEYTAKTFSSGYFTVNYLVPTINTIRVEVSYAGSSVYSKATNTTKFNVKQKTKINILTRGTVVSGQTVKISGLLRLTKNNKGVKAQNVTIIVGSKKYNAKTFSSGYFTVNHVFDASKSKVTVKFIFNGSNSYLASKVTTVLEIM